MTIPASKPAAAAYDVSAGLDLMSGVFGFLAAQQNAAAARSRADLVRIEAEANAQRYAEQAAQFEAHEKVMYIASGVKLAGSPVAALATTARVANENIAAIKMQGEADAVAVETGAVNAENRGRSALVSGFGQAGALGLKGYIAGHGGSDGNSGLGVIADLMGGSR